MKTNLILSALSVVALFGLTKPANAQSFEFSFSGPGITASGVLDTTPLPAAGEYRVLDIIGTRNGQAMSLVSSGPDNNVLLYPDISALNAFGIDYASGGTNYSLYFQSGYQEYAPGASDPNPIDAFTVTPVGAAVPEPGSVALFVSMATVGMSVLRRKRRN